MSNMIQLTFPDGAVKEFPEGITIDEVAASISPSLRKKAIVGKLNNRISRFKTPAI